MTTIKQDDLIQSVADSLQYISYYHSPDFVDAMHKAWQREESESAKNAIAQILINSRMSAEGKRPICQDTGIVVVFVKVGMAVQWDATMSLQEMIDEGVRQAYQNPDNPLRASIVSPPVGKRLNTKDVVGDRHRFCKGGMHVARMRRTAPCIVLSMGEADAEHCRGQERGGECL